LQSPKKTQYWFSVDQSYTAIVYGIPSVKGIVYERGPIPRQGLAFTVDDPDLEGVTFQLTRRDKLGIFAPEGLELETIIGVVKPYLDRATGKPIGLTPLLSPSAMTSKTVDDLELVGNTRLALALGRCYDLLFDLYFILSRTFTKSTADDMWKVRVRLLIIKNLLLKYNPSLKREELESEEKKTLAISLRELLSGGVWWGKKLVKRGLKERYLDAIDLAKELPEGSARDEVFASLSLFSEVVAKLDQRLKGLAAAGPPLGYDLDYSKRE